MYLIYGKKYLFATLQVPVKNRPITSKMPPRFAKKQGGMTIDQPEEGLSANNLGTEIWETNSSGRSRGNTPSFTHLIFHHI